MSSKTRWTLRPSEAIKLTVEQHKNMCIAVALEFQKRVTMKTPVGNPSLWKSKAPPGYVGGHARANWLVSIGETLDYTISVIDASGGFSIRSAQAKLRARSVPDFPVIYVQNNLPYIKRLNEGWSTQAPAEFVDMALMEAAQSYSFEVVK